MHFFRARVFAASTLLLCCSPAQLAGSASANAGPPAAEILPVVILPADLRAAMEALANCSVDGWTREPAQIISRNGRDFRDDRGTVSESIAGDPSIFLTEFGCTHVISQQFSRPQRSATAILYRFEDPDHAYGAYCALRKGSSTVVVRGGASSEDDDNISIWKGRYLFQLHTTADADDLSKALASNLADTVVPQVDADAPVPGLLRRLPKYARVAGSEKLFFGPESVRRYVFVPFLGSLLIGTSSNSVFAEYQYPHPIGERLRYLSVQYPDQAAARAAFSAYTNILGETNKVISQSESDGLFKVSGNFLLARLRGAEVQIIAGGRHKSAPSLLLRSIGN